MGIPGFASRVEQYATRKTMNGENRAAIIDGPGLAHLIYRICHLPNSMKEQAISRPPYARLSRAAVRWLRDLEDHGYEIKAIYFDGALPSYKKEERERRMRDLARNISSLRYRSDLDASHSAGHKLTSTELDCTRINPNLHLDRITPPLLYAAIFEALQASEEYGSITFMVPGEADPFCALATREYDNAVIFTMDSDLLLYDLGPQTEVLYLHTIDCPIFSGSEAPSAAVYLPAKLKEDLGLLSLVGPAFMILINPNQSLPQAVHAWKDHEGELSTDHLYQELVGRYSLSSSTGQLRANEEYNNLVHDLRLIDVRVSEFVCQVFDICGMQLSDGCDMYPAVVVDDVHRAPAWAVCRSLRNLAYSIVLHSNTALTTVREFIRRGNDVAPFQYQLDKNDRKLVQDVQGWTQALDQRINGHDDLPNADAWRFTAMDLLIQDFREREKHIPPPSAILNVLENHTPSNWNCIHFDGQYQVALYSLRMLKQLVDVTMEWSPPENDTVWHAVKGLQGVMEKMPRTAVLFDGDLGGPKRPLWEPLVNELLGEAQE